MTIRTFQPGDEAAQVGIYNEATAHLPRFKPATLDEVCRRSRAADFDPATRFYALEKGEPVAYATFHANGRVSFPWCRKGHEDSSEPLFEAVLSAMRQRGLPKAFAAYRADWTGPLEFFLAHGFTKAREMVNFVLDRSEIPPAGGEPGERFSPLRRGDISSLASLAPEALRTTSEAELDRYYLQNPYFSADALLAQRSRRDGPPDAIGLLITNPAYANPKQIDASMPCFRLGAFGAEGMQTKRVNGLFSFLARAQDVNRLGLELLGQAGLRLSECSVETLAAQVPSDASNLLRFYETHFHKQGSFPVLDRAL